MSGLIRARVTNYDESTASTAHVGREPKMNKQCTITIAVFAIALTGCAQMMTQPLSSSHPGSPAAPEASYASATPILMSGTNLETSPQTSDQQTPKSEPDKSKQHDEHNHNAPKK